MRGHDRPSVPRSGVNINAYKKLQIDDRGSVYIIRLNRPEKMNALDGFIRDELISMLDTLSTNDNLRVLIITGAGDSIFSTGADVNELKSRSINEQRESLGKAHILIGSFINFPWPVIAMINGCALGLGCEIAMACDLRIASTTAMIGLPEIRHGLIPGAGGTLLLPNLIGAGKALELILTGETITADEAEKLGLVNHIFPPQELELRTLEIAGKIAGMSPVAIRAAKEAVRQSARKLLRDGIKRESELFIECFSSRGVE